MPDFTVIEGGLGKANPAVLERLAGKLEVSVIQPARAALPRNLHLGELLSVYADTWPEQVGIANPDDPFAPGEWVRGVCRKLAGAALEQLKDDSEVVTLSSVQGVELPKRRIQESGWSCPGCGAYGPEHPINAHCPDCGTPALTQRASNSAYVNVLWRDMVVLCTLAEMAGVSGLSDDPSRTLAIVRAIAARLERNRPDQEPLTDFTEQARSGDDHGDGGAAA